MYKFGCKAALGFISMRIVLRKVINCHERKERWPNVRANSSGES